MAFEGLTEKLSAAFKKLRGKGRLTEADVKEAMREIRVALLEADVNFKIVKQFVATVTERAVGSDVLESLTPAQMIVKIVNEELTNLMGSEAAKLNISPKPPTVVMLVGLNGAGKTTNGAKLAGYMKKQHGKRPLLVACDTFRPAAITQLEVVGGQLDIPVFQMGQIDPIDIAKAGIEHARKHGNDIVFIDTAGRLHVDEELMEQLKDMKAAISPDEILLIVDAMIGQDAVNAAKTFDEALDITGVMLTKLDGDARGGAALSIKAVTGKPIKFVGVGEKLDQIEVFHPDRMASRILGMGDVLSLIEKAQQNFDMQKAAELEQKLRKNKFTLADFYEQLAQIKNMGSLADIAGMLPGVNAKALEGANVDERALARTEAIILSMTPAERENPSLLNNSRKKRIAAGSGTQVVDINRLLKQFEMMQQVTKQFSGGRMKRKAGLFGKMKGMKFPF
ncbi:signal recognition particle protein [Pseudoflavonifractor sp. DSM 107456]|uniref:Signal recognition particle protein n=1 Tax=Pseudoflavonifractor gallinarum TaxID=2779352 RepID=A0ABR9RD28_9FIRM|nr:signal recognition particle protein [Pseudoflavonifractor gallinarum]MBE5056601.1 signal recognition particle protein [Pseudoflavonifractor gallinarum]MBS5136580.1 signal recognition particle protein [Oscillospiraceae bacterium]